MKPTGETMDGAAVRTALAAPELIERAGEEARAAARAVTLGADIPALLVRLERFLLVPDEPGADEHEPGTLAADVLGRGSARRYARAFDSRRHLLARFLAAAAELPPIETNGDIALPAGTFLHRRVGDPARLAATWLALPHAHGSGTTRDALFAYRDTLARGGYASADALSRGLAGATLLGVLLELPGFSRARPAARAEQASAKSLRETLGRLLDLADTLTLAEPDTLLDVAAGYAADGRAHRARRLLATRLEQAPGEALCALALARAERDRGRFERARRVLERAVRHRSDHPALVRALSRSRAVAAWLEEADEPARMPRVALGEDERAGGRVRGDTLAAAAELYARHGTLLIENAFDPTLLDACRTQFLDEYRDHLDGHRHANALSIGNRRFQVSIALRGAFNDPGFYANPFVLALMHHLLDPQVIVGSTVCATSLPGASDQHLHKDHRALFTTGPDDDPPELPPVAVTLMVPLVALDEEIGTTLVRKGSHRRSRRASERLASQTPLVPLGSCFLMDLSLSHQGLGNRTDKVRPIVNMQYTRRWFVDNKNFHKQRPLEIPREEYARIAPAHRSLFDWARQPGPNVDF